MESNFCWRKWFTLIFSCRLSIAIIQITSDVPDEFYQGPEVAYDMVFGNTERTWEWKSEIRSFVHPLFYAVLYSAMQICRIDISYLLAILPRVQHAIVSSIAETFFCQSLTSVVGSPIASWTAFCLTTCIFANHCFTRTLSNSLETSLLMFAYAYYPAWNEFSLKNFDKTKNMFKFLLFSAMAAFVRPTSVVISLPMSLYCLLKFENKLLVLLQMSFVGFTALVTQIGIDSWFYGHLTFPLWNFVKFNFLSDSNQIFGVNSPVWFFYSGVPGVLGTFLPFFIFGVMKNFTSKKIPPVVLFIIVWTLGIYSIPPHKEMRFILPILPLMLIYAAYFFASCGSAKLQNICRWALVSINAPVTLYLAIYHQSGSIFASHYLSMSLANHKLPSVIVLTPCYTLPGKTHFHIPNATIRTLGCTPNVHSAPDYLTETEAFLMNPRRWVKANLPQRPFKDYSYLVMFDYLRPNLEDLLEEDHFVLKKVFHYSHFPDLQAGQSRNILVYSKMIDVETFPGD